MITHLSIDSKTNYTTCGFCTCTLEATNF